MGRGKNVKLNYPTIESVDKWRKCNYLMVILLHILFFLTGIFLWKLLSWIIIMGREFLTEKFCRWKFIFALTEKGRSIVRWGGAGRASLVAQLVKNLPAMQENPVRFLGQKDPLEKGYGTHLSIRGLPGGSDGKESACQCRRCRLDLWVWESPWRRK